MALVPGASGDEVTQVQILLRAMGYNISASGVYDSATQQAVVAYQSRIGVAQTGNWDTATSTVTLSLQTNYGGGSVYIPPRASAGLDMGRWQMQRNLNQAASTGSFPDAGELDGVEILTSTLNALGLGALNEWAIQQLQIGRSDDEIFILMQDQPAFHDRFPAYRELQQAGRAMTVQEMLAYEDQVSEIFRMAGFPTYFYDGPEDFAALMASQASPMEIQERINTGYRRVAEAHPSVRAAFREYFGIEGDVALAMTFIDPGRSTPTLIRMANEAQVSGAARRMDFSISRPLIEEMVRVGIDEQRSASIFAQLDESRALLEENISDTTDLTAEDVVRGISGLESGTVATLERRRLGRVAAGSGSGGGVGLEQGIQLGAANE